MYLHKKRTMMAAVQLESLQTVLASKASATQRQGRAGRLGPGLCFRLYPRRWWEGDPSTGIGSGRRYYGGSGYGASGHGGGNGGELVPAHAKSEMQRSPLERLVLQTLVLGVADPQPFLLSAMDPPLAVGVQAALDRLTTVGAVTVSYSREDGRQGGSGGNHPHSSHHERRPVEVELTPLGKICAELPLDTALTRMVVLSRGLGGDGLCCAAVALACCMSASRLWTKPRPLQELLAFKLRWSFAQGSGSDAIAALHAYRAWRAEEAGVGGGGSRRQYSQQRRGGWAGDHGLSISALREVRSSVDIPTSDRGSISK